MFQQLLNFLFTTLLAATFPLVHLYHLATSDPFLNTSYESASGLERCGNECLAPYQFVFWGRKASLDDGGHWHFQSRYSVDDWFYVKMGASLVALPVSFVVGGTLKSLALLSPAVRQRHEEIQHAYRPSFITSLKEQYQIMGISFGDPEKFTPPKVYERREEDESHFSEEKKGLREIASCLNAAGIPWWVDCGTLLGAYRYGGIIPWDEDIDIALLLPDFDNVLCALSTLDPHQFFVEDWSSRGRPKTYLKVRSRKTNNEIDLYFFAIDPEKREIRYILSLEDHLFLPEWWNIRERRFKVPTSFDIVFPLKRAQFDGIEVLIPQNPEKYLQLRYGENLAPAKLYNPVTGQYEKDLSHPYWERPFAH